MIQETQLLKRMQQSEYSSLPKPVYHLAVPAAGNLLQKELVVRHSERPTVIERLVEQDLLKGITVELETNIHNVASIFNRSYKITVNVREFLSGIEAFCQITQWLAESQMRDNETAHSGKTNRTLEKEKERILYKRKIGAVQP